MNPAYDQYEPKRRLLEAETNSFKLKPVSTEIYKKSKDERSVLKSVKKSYEASKENKIRFKETRDEIITALVGSSIPSWGGINVGFLKVKP
jgi:hypothetical protein